MFVRTKKRDDKVYLQVVENHRESGKIRQRVIANLGRLDILKTTGQLDGLMASLQRFSDKLAVLGEIHDRNDTTTAPSKKIGPVMIFERLWRTLGIDKVLDSVLEKRKFDFPVERAIFITVLHRLIDSGSDRQTERWKDDYRIDGSEDVGLHHFYRAMGWLGEPLDSDQQDDATPFAPRTTKDLVEELLFEQRRDLFTGLDLVFYDTTSIYFEGEGGKTIGQFGKSKDHRSDCRQMVVAVVLDNDGNPICSEMWPGNTADVTTLVPIVKRLKARFHIHNICIVADRGMISAKTMQTVEEMGWKYILGVRMRRQKEVKEEVLSRAGQYQVVTPKGMCAKDPAPLKVKEVSLHDRRYIVCLNEDQAKKDRYDRMAIVEGLREAIKRGDKSLVTNKGYRRFLKTPDNHFAIDDAKIQEDSRYDGKWVLTTNMTLTTAEVAIKYKQLWMVENIFRSMKCILQTRPVFHKNDDSIRGHVWCSFLALLLRKELTDRLDECRTNSEESHLEWADIIRDLENLVETDLTIGGKSFVVRSDVKGTTSKVFKACGVALPQVVRQCG